MPRIRLPDEHDRVVELGVDDLAVGGDRRERTDVAVHDPRALADDRRARGSGSSTTSPPVSMTTLPSIVDASSTLPSLRGLDASRARAGCSRAAGPSCRCRSTSPAAPRGAPGCPCSRSHWIASVISSSPRADGSIDATASWIVGVEQVDADEREVRRRVRRLLDQVEHLAAVVDRGDPELASGPRRGRAGSARPGASAPSRRPGASRTASTNSARPCWSMLSPRYITKSSSPRKSRAMQHAVGEAERRVLGDVRDAGAEARAVADRRDDLVGGVADDDADLVDPRRDHVLDPVEQDRLVRDRHQLLGARVRDRAQPGARAARQDQPLHRVRQASTIGRSRGRSDVATPEQHVAPRARR